MRDFILLLFCALIAAGSAQAQCNLELNAVNITHPICPAASTGSIFLEVTGGTPPYQYLWSNGFTGAGQGMLEAGVYSITVADDTGCIIEASYELVPSLAANAGSDKTIYCAGAVEIGALPADPGRIWMDGSAVPARFELEDGTLMEFGFTNAYVGTNIPVPNPPDNLDAVTLAVESGQAQLGDQICLPVTVGQFSGLAAFSFTLNYDDEYLQLNGIQQLNEDVPGFDLSAHFIEVNGVVEVSWSDGNLGPASLSDGDTLFLICLTVIGTSQDLTYTWTGPNGFTDDDPVTSVAEPGNYILVVTDNSQANCSAQDEVVVGAADDLNVMLPDTLLFCEGQPLTLFAEVEGGDGLYEYHWSNNITSPSQTVIPASGDVYGLTVTTAGGCSGQDSVLLSPAEDLEIVNVGGIYDFCENDPFTFGPIVTGGVPPYTFNWSTGETTSALFIFESGDYNLTVTDANGCVAERNFEAFAIPVPTVELPSVVTQCPGEITTLMPEVSGGTPPFMYSWSTGSTSAAITVSPEQSTIYRVSVTNEADGCFNQAQTFVEVSGIDVAISVSDCDDSGTPLDLSDDTFTLTLSVSGGSSGSWVAVIDGAAASGAYGIDYTFGPYLVNEGDIQIVLSDADNTDCMFSQQVAAPECATPCIFEEFTSVIVNCNDNGTPGQPIDDFYDIEFWVTNSASTGETFFLEIEGEVYQGVYSSPLLVPGISLPVGAYDVFVTDGADPTCQANIGINITGCDTGCNSEDWIVNFSVLNTTCFGGADGCVIVDVIEGGVPPYAFFWDIGLTEPEICGLNADEYQVTITDATGCTWQNVVLVQEPDPLDVFLQEEQAPSCSSSSDGILSVFIVGGAPPYTYTWPDGSNTSPWVGLSPGEYTITVTDANGCSVAESYLLEPGLTADAGPDQELDCFASSIVLQGNSSTFGPEISYAWTTPSGNILSGASTLNPVVNAPGTYILIVTDHSQPDCFSEDLVVVTAYSYEPILAADLISCDSASISFFPALPGGSTIWTYPDGTTVIDQNPIGTTQSGMHLLSLTDTGNGCIFEDSILVELDPQTCTTLNGRLVQDTLADCMPMPEEPGINGWLIAIDNGDELYYAVTQSDGSYEQQVPVGSYEVYPLVPASYWLSCQSSYMIDLNLPGSVSTLDIPMQEQEACPELTVDFSMPLLRACWTRTLHIQYCNEGTAPATDAYIEVTLDELFDFQSATLPVAVQDGQTFTFNLGEVPANACGYLAVNFVVSCDAVLGQSLCAQAKIYPNEPCAPPDPLWNGASLGVQSSCVEEEVRFTVQNIGSGNMEAPAACIVIEDGVMLLTAPDSLELEVGEAFEYSFPANGSTYRLEVEQVPLHPGNSQPISVVEGCGENEQGSFSTGFVNQFELGDTDAFIDIECREVVASYDPNDKHGFPRGYGEEHLIEPGTALEYLVNFQNTGNDTAFLVVIRDTISEHLDITTLRPGASSHAYTWDIDGDDVLVFTYENILLPDSTTNLQGSQGFVEYKIEQREGLPLGTVIENRAAIYFDINDPIITNTTVHRLGIDFVEIISVALDPELGGAKVCIAPNPAQDYAWLTLEGWPAGVRTLQLFNSQGQAVLTRAFTGDQLQLQRAALPPGLYFFRIRTAEGHQASGRLIWGQ